MNLPNEIFQDNNAGDSDCQRFEQLLHDCLDERMPTATLALDPHLRNCCDCQSLLNVCQQFGDSGGAVLNGGAPPSNAKQRSSGERRFGWPMTSAALVVASAALVLFVLSLGPADRPVDTIASTASENGATTEISHLESGDWELEFNAALQDHPSQFANADAVGLWHSNYVNQLRSAVDYSQQPAMDQFSRVGEVSRILLSHGFDQPLPIGGVRGICWENPWQYTAELPGIRPIHRSMNVALVFYNDSMTLL